MMPLLLRIALSVLLAFVLSLLPMSLWFSRFEDDMRTAVRGSLETDLEALAVALRPVPAADRPARLMTLVGPGGSPFRLKQGDSVLPLPTSAAPFPPAPAPHGPLGAVTPGDADLSADLGDGQRLVTDLPPAMDGRWPPRPGPPPMLIVMVLIVVAAASLIVGIPLIRRIRRVESALGLLAAGDLSVRVPVPRADTLGGLPAALNRCAERLERLFEARKELLEAVSHEIGTPLSRMRFQLELLANATSDVDRRARLDALSGEITELDALSSELVQWVEADGVAVQTVDIPAEPFLHDLVAAEQFASDRPLTANVHVVAGLVFRGEPRQLGRALENVVRNAFAYGREVVDVVASAKDGGVLVVVRDDGPGIPEDCRERVLQPFERLDRSRSRERGGIGLGLAITRRILERHGGTIAITTAPQGGAELQVWVPGARPNIR